MTNQEIIERARRHQRLGERSKRIAADLRNAVGSPGRPLIVLRPAVCLEAAEVIEWLQEQVASLRKDLMEEAKETSRAARESYADGRADAERGE